MAKSRHTKLRKVLKWLGIIIAGIVLLFAVSSWILFERRNIWLMEQLQAYVNRSQSGQLTIGSVDLKPFRSFPKLTVALNDIDYQYASDSLGHEKSSILQAEQIYIAFEFWPLLQNQLKVSELSISNASLNLIENKEGELNLQLALKKPSQQKSKAAYPSTKSDSVQRIPKPKAPQEMAAPQVSTFEIDLEYISLDQIMVRWIPYHLTDTSSGFIHKFEADLWQEPDLINTDIKLSSTIHSIYTESISIPGGNANIEAGLHFDRKNQILSIQNGVLEYDVFSLAVEGSYQHRNNRLLDLHLDASSNDLELLSRIIKPEIIKQNPDLLKEGNVVIDGRIFGELLSKPPQFDIAFSVKDLDIRLPKDPDAFRDLGFDGYFRSGEATDYSKAVLGFKRLRGKIPGGFIKGQLEYRNFDDPFLTYDLAAQLQLDGYDQIFNIDQVTKLAGSISLESAFSGPLRTIKEYQSDSSRNSSILLNNISFTLLKSGKTVNSLSGTLKTKDNLVFIDSLRLNYGQSNVILDAKVEDPLNLIFSKNHPLHMEGHWFSDELFTRELIPDTTSQAQIQDRISNLSFDFVLKTTTNDSLIHTRLPLIEFQVQNLSAHLDKLANIEKINARGKFFETDNGLVLDLSEFDAQLPQGTANVDGTLKIKSNRLWDFNANLKLHQFPWNYITDFAAEIKTDAEPSTKNMEVTKMDKISADLSLSASIVTYPFDFHKLSIHRGSASLQTPDSKPIAVENIQLDLDHLQFQHPEGSGALTGLHSTNGLMELTKLKVPGLNDMNIHSTLSGKNDTLNIKFQHELEIAKRTAGHLILDISGNEPMYQLRYDVFDADVEKVAKRTFNKKIMEGMIDYSILLRTSGLNWTYAKEKLTGDISIQGDSLLIYGVDMDDFLKKYKRSQNFNLADVGAVVIAGPLGLAFTKGSDFLALAATNLDPSQSTHIRTLVADWHYEKELLSTRDMAFATLENRIAVDGVIDLKTDSIPGLTIALIDKNGCSLMDQKIYGKLGALQTGKLNITKTLLGSVINFMEAVAGKDCKVIYNGRVKSPNRKE